MANENEPAEKIEPLDSFVLQHFYRPTTDSVLYHYCSMEAFEAIVRSGKIRMSDINMMNDSAEMGWGYSVFEEAASRILREREGDEKLPGQDYFEEIGAYLFQTQQCLHPLVACFSKKPDVLSQWRGYAADATGVCIGFASAKLVKMCASFLNCEYNFEDQVEQMKERLIAANLMGNDFSGDDHAFHLYGYLPALKNPSFQEEAEVRAVHLLTVKTTEDGVELVDPGGGAFGKKMSGMPIEFGIRKGGIVAFIDFPFHEGNPNGIISEVILGPKNINLPGNISALLMRHGYKGVTIKKSSATYR